MQDVIDQALQRLYWACREGRGFPGVIPDESNGRVSTDAILRGLGLSPPPVENVRGSSTRTGSILDKQAQLLVPRSYHPPDVQPQGLSRTLPTSSAVTPLSSTSDDKLTFGDASSEMGLRGHGPSAMDFDAKEDDLTDDVVDDLTDGLPEGLADSLPDGLGEELQDGVDAKIDTPMMPGRHVGYMGGSTYSNTDSIPFTSGLPLGSRCGPMPSVAQYAIPSLGQQRLESVAQSLGTTEQQVWQGRHDNRVDDALPWPGNMSTL